ncbi:DUF4381 domain-containing protein [Coraliomargarita akajimensis]|uniref:Putative transmembrane protein n=1 Tax=Coraliomargarita akajimensis (strain DSM 45221 / IAM 15411 / JCM 23193 / KCTC 12865 / 04OKA010-24) TaxID=583355 RepID=D5EJW6_CORAD|nr:DUF4381 domain-containing protein [Coraliomargarita akajimensis]ADE54715.1 putative transmembrane protein [Coraliomargarita akajimensis DSM 45221]
MSTIFDPEWGNPSLRTIVEAEFPEPVSLMPSTPGWWLLLLAMVGLLVRALWRRRQRYMRDRYRREALTQLATIKAQLAEGTFEVVRDLAPLLRATAMAATDRAEWSSLQGDAYTEALAELAPEQDRLPVTALHRLAYAPLDEVSTYDLDGLIAALETWILKHRGRHA